MSPFPFYHVSAFSKNPFQGNPAAVVFIDDEDLGADTLKKIAVNFNQPITSVVGSRIPCPDDETVAAWHIRWFTASAHEVALCGHGTVAAASAIFNHSGLVPDSVTTVEFHTRTAGVMRARRVGADGAVEIRLPVGTLTEVSAAENPKITTALAKAFKREPVIKYLGVGGKGFESYLVVELDEQENLAKCEVNMSAFLETGYQTNVITTAASSGEELFVSRMFAPQILPPPFSEDAVCGSAHCLIAPYWAKKTGLPADQPFSAKQVSSRGGDLGLVWDQTAGVVVLTATTFVMAKGEVYL
ncbi:hypothetical protein C8R46DRAFT_421128 [Mycena filopes]|nr:hypothetical protein C8R46DRAFT_421128 [Mycena filopes]